MKKNCIVFYPYKIERFNKKNNSWFLYNGYMNYSSALLAFNILTQTDDMFIYRIIKVLDIYG